MSITRSFMAIALISDRVAPDHAVQLVADRDVI